MIPVVFSDTIGWIHPAAGRRGVVIAGAHGFEDLCSRRFLTLLARRAAEAGHPVIQFDYPGCGDAAGDHTAPDRVVAWTESIGAAIDRLKRETGVEEVAVIGFRLGALLAPLAIAERGDVLSLALLAPPVSGKTYVREMIGLSRMIDGALEPDEANPPPANGLVAAGFQLSGETCEALRKLDWTAAVGDAGVADLLVMPAVVTAKVDDCVGASRGRGATVRLAAFDTYNHLMCDPTANVIPTPVVDIVVDWLGTAAPGVQAPPIAIADHAALAGPDYEEWPVVIGRSPEICGVLCRPAAGDSEEAVLFLNAGAVPHIGWARGTVEQARALAASGISSLRIDLPGLGQSEAHTEGRRFLYDERTASDVVRVVDWLERTGFAGVCAVGTCAGAFQAFHATRIEPRIRRLMLVNPLCFAWNPSYALDMTVWKAYEATMAARAGGSSRAIDGEMPERQEVVRQSAIVLVGKRLIRGGLELVKSGFARILSSGVLVQRPVERWMREINNRGVRVRLVTAKGDLSVEEIERHFGAGGERLADFDGVRRVWLENSDHTVTPMHAKALIAEELIALARPTAGDKGPRLDVAEAGDCGERVPVACEAGYSLAVRSSGAAGTATATESSPGG